MVQDKAQVEANHQRFVERVVDQGLVWGLKSADGWAVAPSNDDESRDVMPFWSDKAYASRAAKEDWSSYHPTEIPLAEFIDHWLRGMSADGVLVGTNWDANLTGMEVEPAVLAQELLRQAGEEE
jgi:hypothetical protein